MNKHICSTCFQEKELTVVNFEPRKDSKTGFRGQCRDCKKNKTIKPTHLKKCVTCGVVKENTSEFFKVETGILNGRPRSKDGLTKKCLCCIQEYKTQYRKDPINKEHRKQYIKKYKVEKKEFIKSGRRKWYENNKDAVIEKNRQWRINNLEKYQVMSKNYRNKNREKLSEKGRVWANEKYQTSELHRVKNSLRARVRCFSKFKKSKPTAEIIGCSWEELVKHLENNFKPGMSWENHGRYGWHIDHIVPLSSAKSIEELHTLNHYTNLQPLWWKDNLSKSDKLPQKMVNA